MSEGQRPPDDSTGTDGKSAPDAAPEGAQRQADSAPGKRLGDFELLRELGRGGMGVVYEARQVSLNRRVALKVLPPGLGLTGIAVRRFEREARAAAKLHHTNIVPVHAIGEEEGSHYYAMELIEGEPLSRVLNDLRGHQSNPLMQAAVTQTAEASPAKKEEEPSPTISGPISLSDTSSSSREWFDTVARLLADVADALHYAHGRGVIHRDVKPANLMLSHDGRLCLTDFGVARVAQEPGMTVSGSFLGTPAYMSPEQVVAGRMKIDHRTDVYSLGAVLYEMLTLRRAFEGETREQIVSGIVTKDPRPPRRFNPRIPLDLETICQKAMEKDPDRRYQSAAEFAADLRQYLQRGLIAARRAGLVRRTWKSIRRHPVAATVVAAMLIVVAASMVAWQAGGRGEAAQRFVSDARLALREGTYREGLQLIDRAVALDPDSIEARLVRARLLFASFRMHEAADEARSVLQTDLQNYSAHTILAGLALHPWQDYRLVRIDPEPHLRVVEANAPESAESHYLRALKTTDTRRRIELLERALELNPGDQLASLARADALLQVKDHELALSEADRLIATRPKSALGWQGKAHALQEQRDFQNALAAIERAMEIDDRDPWNFVHKARILSDMGEKDEALSNLTRSIEMDPTDGGLYRDRAAQLVEMGRFEEAIADALKSMELNPDNLSVFRQLLQSYLSLELEDKVRATIDELRAEADTWADAEVKGSAYRSIAYYYRQLKNYDRALAAADRAIEIDPDAPLHFIRRMLIRKELGDAEGARADCEAAARIGLETPADILSRGVQLFGHCNDFDGALEDFNRVIALAPKWYLGYYWRGFARLYQLGHRDEAPVDFDRAIELAPHSASSYEMRAHLYFAQGRFEEAIAEFRRSVDLDQYDSGSWGSYGYWLFWKGRLEEAMTANEKALKLNPRDGGALADRGMMLAHLGRCDEAAAEVRKVEELALDAFVHRYLAEAYLFSFFYNCPNHYDLPVAIRHAQAAYEALPANPWALETQALALLRKGDYTEAKRIYLELFKETPDGRAGLPLAMCLWHLGEMAEARRYYDRSVTWMEERLPDSPMLIGLRQEAAELLGIEQ